MSPDSLPALFREAGTLPMLQRFWADESGLTSIEYGLVILCLSVWSFIALESTGMV